MRLRTFLPALALAALAGCDPTLTVQPTGEVEESQAIVDAVSARAALGGAYDALTSGSYYGGDFVLFNDVLTDNSYHSGTYDEYADADENTLRADNGVIEGVWDAAYVGIGRFNLLLDRLPGVEGLSDAARDDMLGQVHFLRALAYHDLVRSFGDVPLRLEPTTSLEDAASVTRAPAAQVYAQINADLDEAEARIDDVNEPGRAGLGAVHALRARVKLYQGEWAAAEAAAQAVLDMGYELAPSYGSLFAPADGPTSEDIFRLTFTPQEYQLVGYYYQPDGRFEVAPTDEVAGFFEPGDVRGAWSVAYEEDDEYYWGDKWKTTEGGEDFHVLRLGEVLLVKAEAHARQNELPQAVAEYNELRVRAGLEPHVLGVDVTTQEQVLAAIERERRAELVFEGHRWPDLVRTGRAPAVLGIAETMTLWPIPKGERDVAPGLTQNPGY